MTTTIIKPPEFVLADTIEGLEKQREEIEKDLVDIKSQLEMAIAKHRSGEQRIDQVWQARATAAQRHRGRQHQTVLRELKRRRVAATANPHRAVPDLFIDIARQKLPAPLFKEILDAAVAKNQEQHAAQPQS